MLTASVIKLTECRGSKLGSTVPGLSPGTLSEILIGPSSTKKESTSCGLDQYSTLTLIAALGSPNRKVQGWKCVKEIKCSTLHSPS